MVSDACPDSEMLEIHLTKKESTNPLADRLHPSEGKLKLFSIGEGRTGRDGIVR